VRRRGFGLSLLSSAVAALFVLVAVPAYAGDSFQDCIDKAAEHNGELPICTKVNGSWVATWPHDASDGGGGASAALLVILGLMVAVGVVVWRVTTAQKLAKQSGMDPALATQMTLLSDHGLDATYLAANLRPSTGVPGNGAATHAQAPAARTAAERLSELNALRDQGTITEAEYAERRTSIINDI
jgi:hypothetical protein